MKHAGFTFMAAAVIAAMVVIMHKDNIKRLIKGEEKKIRVKKRTTEGTT